ncbi:hypothetical protein DUNSADRAFT_12120 [Dunaliella salina]|uniref:C2H2-type domain-containing protein n=1 Tax=Dunaliella salina TaxID=3046 RepID=A0ABQ7GC81_DUNSA|nr:hypothetical protein DUNSADRAFT_12120 [Dunaliella salina]|eukprot:KAF5832138.1 hypothetical protein DUNSADRAFT_12120 [Dunaliella salina]
MDQGVLLVCHVDGDELSSFSNPSFTVHHCTSLPTSAVSASACLLARSNRNDMFQKTRDARMQAPTTFVIFYHQDATEDALLREEAFECGANMVTCYVPHVQEALNRVAAQQLQGNITCPWCGLQGLTPESFYLHQPLYHIYHANIDGYCPIKACRASTSNLARHLHHTHPPPGQKVEERTGH